MATVNRTIGADPNMVYESNKSSNGRTSSDRLRQFESEEKVFRKLREESYKMMEQSEQRLYKIRLGHETELIKLRNGADSEEYKNALKLYNAQKKYLNDLQKTRTKDQKELDKATSNAMDEVERRVKSISSGFKDIVNSVVSSMQKAYGSFSLSGASDNVANQIADFRKEFSAYAVNNMNLDSMKDAFSSAIGNINSQLGTNYTAADAINAVKGLAGTASGLTSLRGMSQQQLQQLIQMNLTGQLTGSNALTQQTSTYLRMGARGSQLFQNLAGNIAYQQQVNPYFDMNTLNDLLGNQTVTRNLITGRMSPESLVSGLSSASMLGVSKQYGSYETGDLSTSVLQQGGSSSLFNQMALAAGLNVLNPESMSGTDVANILASTTRSARSIAGDYNPVASMLGLSDAVYSADLSDLTAGSGDYLKSISDYQGKAYQALQEQGRAQADSYTKAEKAQRDTENLLFDVLPIQSDGLEISTMILSGVNEIVKLLNIGNITNIVSSGTKSALESALGGTGSKIASSWLGTSMSRVGSFALKASPWIAAIGMDVALGVKLSKERQEIDKRIEQEAKSAQAQGYEQGKTGYDAIVGGTATSKYNQSIIHGQRTKASQTFISSLTPEQMAQIAADPKSFLSSDVYKGAVGTSHDIAAERESKSNSISSLTDAIKNVFSAFGAGNATGIDNVTADGYLAKLHKGEMVLPGPQANFIRSMFGLETKPISGVYSDPGYRTNVMGIPEYASGTNEQVAGSSIGDYVGGGAKRDSVNSLLLGRLVAFAKAMGKKITVVSGYRSSSYQAQLYKNAKNKSYVAKPGNSMHMSGLAADIDNASSGAPDSVSWFRSMPDDSKLYPFKLWRPLLHSKSAREAWHVEAFETGYPNLRNKSEEYTARYLEKKYGKGNGSASEYSGGSITMDEASDGTTSDRETGQGGMFDYLQEYSDDPTVANLLAMYGGNYSSESSGTVSGGSYDNLPDNSAYESNKFKPILEKYGSQYGINPRLLYGMMMTESSGNPDANKNKNRQYKGLMQINQAKVDSIVGQGSNIYDPDVNIHAGAAYLASTIAKTGRTSLGIAGYNTGPGLKVYKTAKQKLDSGAGWDSVSGLLNNHRYVEKAYNYAGVPMTPQYLADGGIVTEPTLAMVGEGRPGESRKNEAVIPLDDSGSILSDTLGLTDFQDVFTSTMNFNLNSLLSKMDQIIASVVVLQNAVFSGSSAMDIRNNSLASFNYR